MKKIIEKIEGLHISPSDWLLGFSCIVFIRCMLESISNPSVSGIIASDPQTIIHYALFYASAIFGIICIVEFFTNYGKKMANVMLFLLCGMWIAPTLDIIFSKGKGFQLAYISDGGTALVRDFFTFFGPSFTRGATYGIRIELLLIFIGFGLIIFHLTKSAKKTILGIISIYIFTFIVCALPGILYSTASLLSPQSLQSQTGSQYIESLIVGSNISFNSIHTTFLPNTYNRFLEIGFDKLMSQFYYILLCLSLFIWFWRIKKDTLIAIFKNSRPERALHYIIMLLIGIWASYVMGLGRVTSWMDVIGIVCLIIAWYSVWVFAININDCEDLEIDKISNQNRPLVQGVITEREMKQSAFIFLTIALLGAWSAGFYPFYMMLVFVASSYIYSAKPLRLKVFPIVATFLMAVASLASVLAGFFFLSHIKFFYAFPPLAMIGILISYTLFSNAKDLKDILGDKIGGSYTIPVIFGEKKGIQIIALMVAVSFLIVPFFLNTSFLYIISIPAGIAGYFAVKRFPHKEKYIIMIYFLYIVLGFVLYL